MLLRAWVDNWNDVWKDRYADMLAGKVEALYAQYRHEFNSVGLWVNESGNRGKVLVTGCLGGETAESGKSGVKTAESDGTEGEETAESEGTAGGETADGSKNGGNTAWSGVINVEGTAEVYVVGDAEVHCYDNSSAYNHAANNAIIVLHDYSRAYIDTGICVAYNNSKLNMNGGKASCYHTCDVNMDGGVLRDHGHRIIRAWGNETIVYSRTNRRIELHDGAQIIKIG